jgi:heme O synthase-like polyprenyltransferase
VRSRLPGGRDRGRALAFAALAARGLWRGDARWARAVFLASIVYLPTVYAAMVVDGRL